jgi:ribonuclease Z
MKKSSEMEYKKLSKAAFFAKKNNLEVHAGHGLTYVSALKVSRIKAILLTHSHFDHCWGLPPFLKTMQLDGRTEPLTIIAPTTIQAINWVQDNYGNEILPDSGISSSDFAILFRQWNFYIENGVNKNPFPIKWLLVPIDDYAPQVVSIQPLDGFQLTAIPTKHGVTSVGWLISSKEKKDRRILISGDTTTNVPSFNELALSGPLDLLIHEATFTNKFSEKAGHYWHSTASDAAKAAVDTNANLLGMIHFSPRIDNLHVMEEEARCIHPHSVACADGDIFRISDDGRINLMRKQNNSWILYDTLRT